MPIPFMDDDSFKRRCLGWQSKLSILPRACYYSGRSLWFKKAFKGTAMITGPGDPVFEDRWVHSKEYLFLKIKGTI